ncbi:unnamed protein product [Vitrella brassicaformis CCMP3155]|uniref:MYND-type domain-containing protein n=3 Tax=Vitrella brassicaformis TaxID=1169539 RepID=A0A0G4EKZ2_VITBC|nr:unnamed protein product [Vitrella brassicaformis CCMP3155]|eukprot:CEL97846.1 unnamed protein product [Vitrella brassicaformis CCMP3155]
MARLASTSIGDAATGPATCTSSASGGRLPFSFSEMAGYKVRLDASTPDPDLELQQCIVCGKRPEPGQRLKVCQFCVREVSPRYCSDACLKQHFQQGRHNKAMCRLGKQLYDGEPLRGNRHAVRMVLNWMSEDVFFKQQRQKQEAIRQAIEEHSRQPTEVPIEVQLDVHVKTFDTNRLFCVAALGIDSENIDYAKHRPPPGTGPIICDRGVSYGSYLVIPITTRNERFRDTGWEPPPDPQLEATCAERVVAVLSKAISTLLTPDVKSRRRIQVASCISGSFDVLFWRKMTCTVAHPVCGHRLPFYCLPPPFHVVLRAVEAAIHDVLGTEANDDINSVLFPQNLVMRDHMTLQRMMVRDEWRQEIEWERSNLKGLHETIDRICHELALQSGTRHRKLNSAVGKLKADFVEAAVGFTDLFRRHLIEYVKRFKRTSAHDPGCHRSFPELADITEGDLRPVEAEVASAEYPRPYKNLIAAKPTCSPDIDGPMATTSDGKNISEVDLLLRTQGFVRGRGASHRHRVSTFDQLVRCDSSKLRK